MRKRNTFKRQHLDRLLQIMGQNIPRPQQSFGNIREGVEELLPAVYSELTESLRPLGLLEISEYRLRVCSDLYKLQAEPWHLRLDHELFPLKEHPFSISFLEENDFRLDRILRPEEEGQARSAVIELCHLHLGYFLDITTEIEKFLRGIEEVELEKEELRTGLPMGFLDIYACWCSRFWENLPTEGGNSEDPGFFEKNLQILDILYGGLLLEMEINIALQSPEVSYRYLLRLQNRFSRNLEAWENLNTPPNPELLLENRSLPELENGLGNYCERMAGYLRYIRLVLDEKLEEVMKKIREEGSTV